MILIDTERLFHMDYVLLIIVSALVFLPIFAIIFNEIIARIDICKIYEKRGYACPNCGKHIHISWKKLMLGSRLIFFAPDVLRMKCPHCNQMDWCELALDKEYVNEQKKNP